MRTILTVAFALFLTCAYGAAVAGPGGYFRVMGQGTTQNVAKSDAISKATAVCSGQGAALDEYEFITVEQMGSTWRALLMAKCT